MLTTNFGKSSSISKPIGTSVLVTSKSYDKSLNELQTINLFEMFYGTKEEIGKDQTTVNFAIFQIAGDKK